MGVSFFETMSGHLVDRWGRSHPVDFDIKAEATHLRRFVVDGTARVTGVLHAPPWASAAAIEGSIRIRPLFARRITYDLRFRDDEDRALRLWGEKRLSALAPLATGSTMAARLECDDDVLARGEIRFDLNQLLSFAGSWWPSTAIRALPLHRDTSLDEGLLAALAEAVIVQGDKVPAPDGHTLSRALEITGRLPAGAQSLIRAGLRALDARALATHGRRFAALDVRARRELVADSRVAPALSLPLRMAHFGRRDYLEALGVPDTRIEVNEPDPPWTRRIVPAEELEPGDNDLDAEVVVIGSGAGGAALAARLAEAGVVVAVVEEGRYHGRRSFSGSPLDRMNTFYRSAGLTFTLGRPPISVPMGKMIGGTTVINSGTCFRTPGPVLAEWREELGLSDAFSPAALSPWFDEVERELGVGPNAAEHLGEIARVVARGADAMGLQHGPLDRNAPGCDGQGLCCFGCPTDAKRGANVSWMPRALEAGATAFTGLPVTRILRRGRRIVGVEARGADRHGVAKVLRIRAEAVVVACGTLLSPVLLRENGFRLPWIGRNLSVHPGFGMLGLFDQRMDPWNAVPQGYGIHGLDDDRIRFEGFWMPPEMIGGMLPVVGAELTRWMDVQDRVGQFGFMVRDSGVGSVVRGPDGRPVVRYDLSDASLARLRRGASVLAEVLLRGGAREVLPGVRGVPAITTLQQARDLAHAALHPMDFALLGAHPLGTCRMATGPDRGVVDIDHKVFGTDNLYVVDGSAVPTSLGVNPQITIMAMALRAADGLVARLGGTRS